MYKKSFSSLSSLIISYIIVLLTWHSNNVIDIILVIPVELPLQAYIIGVWSKNLALYIRDFFFCELISPNFSIVMLNQPHATFSQMYSDNFTTHGWIFSNTSNSFTHAKFWRCSTIVHLQHKIDNWIYRFRLFTASHVCPQVWAQNPDAAPTSSSGTTEHVGKEFHHQLDCTKTDGYGKTWRT